MSKLHLFIATYLRINQSIDLNYQKGLSEIQTTVKTNMLYILIWSNIGVKAH